MSGLLHGSITLRTPPGGAHSGEIPLFGWPLVANVEAPALTVNPTLAGGSGTIAGQDKLEFAGGRALAAIAEPLLLMPAGGFGSPGYHVPPGTLKNLKVCEVDAGADGASHWSCKVYQAGDFTGITAEGTSGSADDLVHTESNTGGEPVQITLDVWSDGAQLDMAFWVTLEVQDVT